MPETNAGTEAQVLQTIIASLSMLDQEAQRRLLQTVATFLRIDFGPGAITPAARDVPRPSGAPLFSEREDISPKAFVVDKQPRTDVERVACLAYYLTHFRDTPHFKTADIAALNTEAAQPRFSNASYAVENATKLGHLVPASKGTKQLGAMGEQFVLALPDYDAAKAILSRMRPRRPKRRASYGGVPYMESPANEGVIDSDTADSQAG